MENKDTRYFIEMDIRTRKIINHAFVQKQTIDLSEDPKSHKIFLTKGQYHKFLKRLEN